MKILSFDVGIKNLSYCYLDTMYPNTDRTNIVDWNNLNVLEADVNCNKVKFHDLTECVLTTLSQHFNDCFEADVVLIENQPAMKNGQMKSVSLIMYTYFNLLRMQFGNIRDVKFISATNKLKCKRVPEGSDIKTYKNRKKLSIDVTKLYIADICPDRVEWFNGLPKSDDVCDAFLQAMYFIESL
jgi:hypothetical protein